MDPDPASPVDRLIRAAFDAYNGQDSRALLTLVTDDVRWSSEAGTLRGKDALAAYWTRQWATTRTHDEVVAIAERPGGEVVVELDQVVRSLDGAVLSTGRHAYVFETRDGLIAELRSRDA